MEFVSICCGKLTLFWRGPFSFCSQEILGLPDKLPGVFVLSAFTPLRLSLVAYYVGQSSDLRRRLGEHFSGKRTFAVHLRSRLSTYYSVAAVSDPGIRTAAEAALIRRLRPAGNEVIPGAPSIETSLPPLLLFNPNDGS
jgi:predicted GIY-YIG superfamily endonuclease